MKLFEDLFVAFHLALERKRSHCLTETLIACFLMLVFHTVDLMVVKGDHLPSAQHADKQTMIIVHDHGQTFNVLDGHFLEHRIQIFHGGTSDDVRVG